VLRFAVPFALLAVRRVVVAAFFARVCAPFFAAVLRLVAARLRVAAAFFAAALRLAGPRVMRSSRSSASLRRSSSRVSTCLGVRLRVPVVASAICLATCLRRAASAEQLHEIVGLAVCLAMMVELLSPCNVPATGLR
jgi:hypothetical protein